VTAQNENVSVAPRCTIVIVRGACDCDQRLSGDTE